VIVLRKRLPKAFAPKPHRYWFAGGTLLGMLTGPVLILLWLVLGDQFRLEAGLAGLGLDRGSFAAFAVFLILTIPLLEEMFWRGILYNRAPYPVPADILFSAFHLPIFVYFVPAAWLAIPFIALVIAAWLWRMMRSATGGIGCSLASHLIADISGLAAVWALIYS